MADAKYIQEETGKVLRIQKAFILTTCTFLEQDGASPKLIKVLRDAADNTDLIHELIAKLLEGQRI